MAILTKGTAFTSDQQVTSTNLNALVDFAAFVPGASGTTDDSTLEVNGGGRLQIKDLGVTAAKLAADSVVTAKIQNLAVTPGKLSAGAPSWTETKATLTYTDVAGFFDVINTETTGTGKNPSVRVSNYSGGLGGFPAVIFYTARGTQASPAANQSGDSVGSVFAFSHNGSGFSGVGRIDFQASENHGGSNLGTVIRFLSVENGSTSFAERMRISETGGLLIGTSTDQPSAILTMFSTSKGFLPPRMTTTQRNAISSPAAGLIVYNTTTAKLNFYNGSGWEAVTSA